MSRPPAPLEIGRPISTVSPEHGRLVCRAVPDDQGATPIGERVNYASERRTQGCRVLCDQLGIRTAQCIELAAPRLLVRFAPAFFAPGAQTCLDDDSACDPLAERGEKTGERLGRTLRTRGNK